MVEHGSLSYSCNMKLENEKGGFYLYTITFINILMIHNKMGSLYLIKKFNIDFFSMIFLVNQNRTTIYKHYYKCYKSVTIPDILENAVKTKVYVGVGGLESFNKICMNHKLFFKGWNPNYLLIQCQCCPSRSLKQWPNCKVNW